MAPKQFRMVFAIYSGMTQLDFTGPHQFLSQLPDCELLVASTKGGTVSADGLHFGSTSRLADITHCDLLFVPGGHAATQVALDDNFLDEIIRLGRTSKYITSVCTGSLILGAAGFLVGKRAACHWASRKFLPEFGAIPDSARVVRDGNVITGGGVTAGIDFALTVISELAGDKVAQAVQLGMEYLPSPPFTAGSPETAPPEVVSMFTCAVNKLAESRSRDVLQAANKARNNQGSAPI